jgi:ATP-binding cassette subfamily C protein CydC
VSNRVGWLVGMVRSHRRGFALAAVLQFATGALGVGLMATSAWLISTAALHPSIAVLGVAIVGVRFFGLARGVSRYLERLASHEATLSLLANLRVRVFRALAPLAPAGLRSRSSGDLVARLVDDVETLNGLFIRILGPSLSAVLVTLVLMWILGARGWPIAGAGMAGLVVAGLVAPAMTQRLGSAFGARLVTERGVLAARLADAVQGVADLLVFDRAASLRRELRHRHRHLAGIQIRAAMVSSGGSATGTLVGDLTAVAVFVLAASAVQAGQLEGVQIAVVVLATMAAFEVASPLAAAYESLGRVRAAARRVIEIEETPPTVAAPATPAPAPAGLRLEVRNLRFWYPGARHATLDRVSFSLEPGRCIAVVGPSGSGKSTLANLLVRFWDVEPGQIWLDGRDLREYAHEDVRACVTLAEQQTPVLTGTIRDNLLIARPDASTTEMMAVLKTVRFDRAVRELPAGLDTWLGEHGLALSGGERQRLALARALLRDTPFVILDEPTANVDPETENEILEAVGRLARTRGVLLITHRAAGQAIADEILVLPKIDRDEFQ